MNGSSRAIMVPLLLAVMTIAPASASSLDPNPSTAPGPDRSVAAPDYSFTCSPTNVALDVGPGEDAAASTNCTISNEDPVYKRFDVSISSGALSVEYPAEVTVPPLSSVTFEVKVKGEERMPEGQRTLSVTVTHSETTGIPVTGGERIFNVIVVIRQFAELEARVPNGTARASLVSGGVVAIPLEVTNTGNAYDRFNVSIIDDGGLDGISLQDGDVMQVELDSNESREVIVNVSLSEAWVGAPGSRTIALQVSSEYAERSSAQPVNESVPIEVLVVPSLGASSVGVESLVGVIAFWVTAPTVVLACAIAMAVHRGAIEAPRWPGRDDTAALGDEVLDAEVLPDLPEPVG